MARKEQDPIRDQPRNRGGRYTAKPETAERDAKAVRLRIQGLSLRQIADELGFSGTGAAANAIKRAFARTSDGVVRDYQDDRELQVARLDTLIVGAYEALTTFVPMVDNRGQLVINPETGQPYRDFGIMLGAMDRIVKIEARRASLLRLDIVKSEDADANAVDAEFGKLVERLESGTEG